MDGQKREVDPVAILRAINTDSKNAQAAFSPNAPLLYVTWGVSWIVGFLAL